MGLSGMVSQGVGQFKGKGGLPPGMPTINPAHSNIFVDLMDNPGRTDILITKATARLDRHVTCRLQPLLMK